MPGGEHARGTPDQFELRVLTSDDWETWRSIRLEALAQAPYAFGSEFADWQTAPEERWRARLELERSHNVVAFSGDAPVGMATGVPGDRPGAAALISMYVAPSARGTGLAGSLLEAVERWARSQDFDTLCLHVRASNLRARLSYERHGLVVTGEVEPESPDDPVELEMCMSLTESPRDGSTHER